MKAGNTDYENTLADSPEEFYNDVMITGHFLSNPDTLWNYATHVGEAWDFVIDHTEFDAYSSNFKGAAVNGKTTLRAYAPTTGRGSEFTIPMEKAIQNSGLATILTRTEGYELVLDGGKVTGVKAVNNQNGQQYVISADKGVVLATGMMTGETAVQNGVVGVYNRGKASNTGDGHRMALDAGADTWLLGLTARGGRMITDNFEYGTGVGISIPGVADLFAQGGAIAVEKHGRRFSDENAILGNNELIANLTDGQYYVVMDQQSFEEFLYVNNGKDNGFTKNNFDLWLAQNNCGVGGIAHGATLQEAAANAGIDGDRLNATVQYYNYCIENGIADMYKREGAVAIADDGQYYIMRLQPAFNSGSGGILVNNDCAVVSTSGDVIEGLYAAGSVAGGANGEIYYMGGTVGWALTSGYLAGQAVSK